MIDQPAAPPPAPPVLTIWELMMAGLGPLVEEEFRKRFNKPIHFTDEPIVVEGRLVPNFRFRMARPGLLPTAIEAQWFDGFIAGFKTFFNHAIAIAEPRDRSDQ